MSRPLAIGIDIRLIGKNRTGDEMVFFQLVRELIRRRDRSVRYELYTDEDTDDRLAALRIKLECLGRADIEIVSLPTKNRFLWNGLVLPWRLFRHPVDVFHTQYILPLWLPKSLQVCAHIHDLSFRVHPEWISTKDRFFLALFIPRTLRRADAIIAVSEFTRSELLAQTTVDPARVRVIENAAAEEWFQAVPEAAKQRVAAKFGLVPGTYFISSGTMQPRKNIPFLIAAFRAAMERAGSTDRLVLTGNQVGYNADPQIQRESAERIVFTGYVSDAELRALLAGARALIFPSLYEGFGIPIEEALAQGVPVLASDIPAFREVGADRVTYFHPSSLAEATETLYTFSVTKPAPTLPIAPIPHPKRRYSWEKSAEKLLGLYHELAASSSGAINR